MKAESLHADEEEKLCARLAHTSLKPVETCVYHIFKINILGRAYKLWACGQRLRIHFLATVKDKKETDSRRVILDVLHHCIII